MFGILSVVLVLSFLTFSVAKDAAEERVIETHADSVAQRVASMVVEVSVFAEQHADRDVFLETTLELPQQIEGRSYRIDLGADKVTVTVPSTEQTATAPLFQAGAPNSVHVCDQSAFVGDALMIRVTDQSHPTFPTSDCPGIGAGELAVFLEIIG